MCSARHKEEEALAWNSFATAPAPNHIPHAIEGGEKEEVGAFSDIVPKKYLPSSNSNGGHKERPFRRLRSGKKTAADLSSFDLEIVAQEKGT